MVWVCNKEAEEWWGLGVEERPGGGGMLLRVFESSRSWLGEWPHSGRMRDFGHYFWGQRGREGSRPPSPALKCPLQEVLSLSWEPSTNSGEKNNEKEPLIYDESPGEKKKERPPPFESEGGPHIKTFPLSRKKANVSKGSPSILNLFGLWCVCEACHQPLVRPSNTLLFLHHANTICVFHSFLMRW